MPTRLLHPILFYIARKTGSELALVVEYLKAENEVLRSMLPKHIQVAPKDRDKLLKLGQALGAALKFLITIVTYTTFLKWGRDGKKKKKAKPTGRPRTDESVEALVLRFAAENGWGYTRIYGEFQKLKIKGTCRSTIKNILERNGFDTGPKRGKGTWFDFIERHAKTLWACDFLSKRIWTKSGFQQCFALFFLHIGTRRVYLAGVTANPSKAWVEQQARNFVMHLDASPEAAEKGDSDFYLIQDHDDMFTAKFRTILKAGGVESVRTLIGVPVLNAFAERWVRSFRVECLDHFIVFGVKHFLHIAMEYVGWYNSVRPHQGIGNVPIGLGVPVGAAPPPEACGKSTAVDPEKILCDKRLGGLLKHYYRQAA